MTSGLKLRYKKNKNILLRSRQNRTSNINKQKDVTIYSNPGNSGNCTLSHIEVITNDEDPGSVILSLDAVSDCFKEGVTVFRSGQIHVYPYVEPTYLDDLEKMAPEKQWGLLGFRDVFTGHETFLLYQNKQGNAMVLPKNSYFLKAFAKLEKEICNKRSSKSNVRVVLKDIVKCAQKGKEKHTDEALLQYDITENHVKQSDLEQRDYSLKVSKKRTCSSKKKCLITEHGKQPLTLCLRPLEPGQPKFPIQVSQEQRDDEQVHSEQVVSYDHSNMPNSHISYGFNSSVNTMPSTVTNSAVNDHRSRDRPNGLPRYAHFSEYVNRLTTYSTWPHGSPNSERLSRAGFFFTKNGDLVRCFQCGIGLKDFSPDDDPLLEHIRHSVNCEFLPKLLGEERLSMYKAHLQATDPEYNRRFQWHERHSSSASRTTHRHPEYQSQQSRISSFAHWPSQMAQTPEQLADAGFYYTGFEDHVRCFACGGGLRRWDLDDDPWTEHCRWFPACPHAIEQKGEQFIALVQAAVENQGSGAGGGLEGLEGAVAQLQLRESEAERIAAEHIDVCLEMGYTEEILKKAIKELIDRESNYKPALDDIIDLIDVIREREQTARLFSSSSNESPIEENERLRSIVFCLGCGKNNINALFLPCTHHRLCMSCAEPIDKCPVCHRNIREKIRTYMA